MSGGANRHPQREEREKRREPQQIGDVISELMARSGYGAILAAFRNAGAWRAVCGESLAARSQPGRFRRGVLEIVADHSLVLQELSLRKRQLLKDLQEKLPDQAIRDLRFRVGKITSLDK